MRYKPLTLYLLIMIWLFCPNQKLYAHGGVSLDGDVCALQIGFLKAHFTGYQPDFSNEEFCEDIPQVAESVFVIDYLHDFLKQMPVDFRIIKDVNGFGQFAKWEDIRGLEDINQDTVFYQDPSVHSNGVLTVTYEFEEKGGYIGVITAQHPTKDLSYNAVFYFQVGGGNYGYYPLIIAFLVLMQGLYWFSNRPLAIEQSAT